jgi:hypothetical protein
VNDTWYEPEEDDETELYPIDEYDLLASPNDFNVVTLRNFIDSGVVKIPVFQRNYVWDIGKASRLIESLIIGIPVPQIFLYEEERNKFLVIDGQQRLMSIYYFMHGRFPVPDSRVELRRLFDEHGSLPEAILHEDRYFSNFRLKLSAPHDRLPGRFNKLTYATLGDYKTNFELRTIRAVVVRKSQPSDDDSAMYEMFNRLNTGGVALAPQEIRMSLYHSNFYDLLARYNLVPEWRRFIGQPNPDVHLKDVEFLLRASALLIDIAKYKPPMSAFLNGFSRRASRMEDSGLQRLESTLSQFFEACVGLEADAFYSQNRRFSMPVFESVFVAAGRKIDAGQEVTLSGAKIDALKRDEDFLDATARQRTTDKANVNKRIARAEAILFQ